MLKFYVVYEGGERRVINRIGHTTTNDITKADALWFTGGADIPTSLYNQKNVASGGGGQHDQADLEAIRYWENNKDQFKIMVGACRGGQLLNCISGGNMWQDVDGHYGKHTIIDVRTGQEYITNSIHHQMMRPSKDAEIIAVSNRPLVTQVIDDTGTYRRGEVPDFDEIEVLWYPHTRSLCFQGHPEYMEENTTAYFEKIFHEKYAQL